MKINNSKPVAPAKNVDKDRKKLINQKFFSFN